MDRGRAERVLALFEQREQVEALESAGPPAAAACLDRADDRHAAATLLAGAGHAEAAYISAYDAYRMAGEAVVLPLGYRVPAVPGAHRITQAGPGPLSEQCAIGLGFGDESVGVGLE